MACGECGDPRGLCRCTVAAADGSVVITGTGEVHDPYLISAPGAGAGTRTYDRASIYALPAVTDDYQLPLPPYPHFDFFGQKDPSLIPGFAPSNYDGWFQAGQTQSIAFLTVDTVESVFVGSAAVPVAIPGAEPGSVVIVIISAAGAITAPSSRWESRASVATGAGRSMAVFTLVTEASDAGTTAVFTAVGPSSAFYAVTTGVAPDSMDVTPTTAQTPLGQTLLVPALTTVTPGAVVIAAASLPSPSAVLATPESLVPLRTTTGNGPRLTAGTMVKTVAGNTGAMIWSKIPNLPESAILGVTIALRPRIGFRQWLWVTGQWIPVGQSIGGLTNESGSNVFAVDVGDGVNSSFSVTHLLDSQDVQVEVYNTLSGQTAFPVVLRSDPNTVILDFGGTVPTVDAYRAVIRR